MYKRITALPHYCHKMSSSILQKLPAPRVIKIMRQQLCKYCVEASSNVSISWQYFACLSWKVKRYHFNTKVPLKLNFCPGAEERELNEQHTSSLLSQPNSLSQAQCTSWGHALLPGEALWLPSPSALWGNLCAHLLLCFMANNRHHLRIKVRCERSRYVLISLYFLLNFGNHSNDYRPGYESKPTKRSKWTQQDMEGRCAVRRVLTADRQSSPSVPSATLLGSVTKTVEDSKKLSVCQATPADSMVTQNSLLALIIQRGMVTFGRHSSFGMVNLKLF